MTICVATWNASCDMAPPENSPSPTPTSSPEPPDNGNGNPSPSPTPTAVPVDARLSEMTEAGQFGRQGDVVAISMDLTVCNAGDAPISYVPLPSVDHPYFTFNFYRLHEGRFQQIGQSWVKHAFSADRKDACDLGCEPAEERTQLGIGCSDTYRVTTNTRQDLLGPRDEINPWTGEYTYKGSHLDPGGGEHDDIEHRLQVADADLDPQSFPGATFYCESMAVVRGDTDHGNNIVHEPTVVTGVPSSVWFLDITDTATMDGPAILSWPGAEFVTISDQSNDDGQCILAARATELSEGNWHYEYALFNLDLHRQVRSLALAVPESVTISNIGFAGRGHAEDMRSADGWTSERFGKTLVWMSEGFELNPQANALRWGSLYNFWFDANQAPGSITATLGLFLPGEGDSISGQILGPS